MQRSRDDGSILANSPSSLAKLRFAVMWVENSTLSSGMQYESSRLTLAEASLKPVYAADFTLTSKHLLPNFDVRLGLRKCIQLELLRPDSRTIQPWIACPNPDVPSLWN